MNAESVLLGRGFRRLEVAVELVLPDAVRLLRWTRVQRCHRHHRTEYIPALLGLGSPNRRASVLFAIHRKIQHNSQD